MAKLGIEIKLTDFDMLSDLCNALSGIIDDERIPKEVREDYLYRVQAIIDKQKASE